MATTNTLLLFLQVERLGPDYDGDGSCWFSINVSAALEDEASGTEIDYALVRSALRPWIWTWDHLRVLGIDGDEVRLRQEPVPVSEVPDEQGNWLGILDGEMPESDFHADDYVWDPHRPLEPEEMGDGLRRKWRGYLAHVSTYPADLANQAGLVRFFKLPADAVVDWDEIVVAPVFDALFVDENGTETGATPEIPTGAGCLQFPADPNCPVQRLAMDFQPWQSDDDYLYSWSYEPVAGRLDVRLYQSKCPVELSANDEARDGLVNLKMLWIDSGGIEQGDDWAAEMELRVAEAFDLPQRLLEAAETATGDDDLIRTWLQSQDSPLSKPEFRTAFLASLRDLAHTGWLTPPDGISPDGAPLAEEILSDLQDRLDDIDLDDALDHLRDYDAGLDRDLWKALLDGHVPARLGSDQWLPEPPVLPPWSTEPEEQERKIEEYRRAAHDYLEQLEKIRLLLADDGFLVELVVAQWDAALTGHIDPEERKRVLTAAAELLAPLNLRKRFELANAGLGWAQLAVDFSDQAQLAEALEVELRRYYENRFNPASNGSDPYAARKPRAADPGLEDPILARLQEAAEAAARSIVPADEQEATPLNTGVRIRIAKPERNEDLQDFAARVRGACVVMRRQGQDWCLLHLGQYSIRGELTSEEIEEGNPGLQFDPSRTFPVPFQLLYRNGVRQVNMVYQNQPLSARSPAAMLSRKRMLKPLKEDAQDGHDTAIFEFWSPYGLSSTGPRLPRLVFGETYDVAAFVVGLAGNLPAMLAEPDTPWVLSSLSSLPDPPAESVKELTYGRTVQVGQLRVQPHETQARKSIEPQSWLPPIPERVYPLARTLSAGLDDEEERRKQQNPLILLADGPEFRSVKRSSARFFVRPPAVDVDIWDSWENVADMADLERRARILGKVKELSDLSDGESKDLRDDATLDDPAVWGVRLKLVPEFPAGGSPEEPLDIQFRLPQAGGDPLEAIRAIALRVEVAIGQPGLQPIQDEAGVVIGAGATVPAGEVWLLEMSSVLDAGARDKFHEDLRDDAFVQEDGLDLVRENRSFWIEVAQSLPEQSDQIARSLTGSLTPAWDPEQDRLGVRLSPIPDPRVKPYQHRVEVFVQRWRWQGRPLFWNDNGTTRTGFPFEQAAQDPDLLERLDGMLFGDRDEDDYLIAGSSADFGARSDLPPVAVYVYDLTGSPQALYYRFAVRVFSRYEGLLRSRLSLDSRRVRRTDAQRKKVSELWRRLVIPCRRKRKLEPPLVKLVLPLTQTRPGAEEQTPSLMVVLEESWQEYAGLAEQFQAMIGQAFLPEDFEESRPEFGPDPINDLRSDERTYELPDPVGPVGYTFDTDTDAPLFVRAAFVLPAPLLAGAPVDLAGYFIQLAFRRSLDPAGTAEGFPAEELASKWTEPVWAQYLAASDWWETDAGRVPASELRFDPQRRVFDRIVPCGGTQHNVRPEPSAANQSDKNILQLWVLLTDLVQDALGRTNQEVFRDFVQVRGLAGAQEARFARLVEIQRRREQPDQGLEDIVRDLFPAEMEPPVRDARARVTRVSPRIEPTI